VRDDVGWRPRWTTRRTRGRHCRKRRMWKGVSVATAAMKLEQRAQFALVAGHLLFRHDAILDDVRSEPATRGEHNAWRRVESVELSTSNTLGEAEAIVGAAATHLGRRVRLRRSGRPPFRCEVGCHPSMSRRQSSPAAARSLRSQPSRTNSTAADGQRHLSGLKTETPERPAATRGGQQLQLRRCLRLEFAVSRS
jgi:hypothetical protein